MEQNQYFKKSLFHRVRLDRARHKYFLAVSLAITRAYVYYCYMKSKRALAEWIRANREKLNIHKIEAEANVNRGRIWQVLTNDSAAFSTEHTWGLVKALAPIGLNMGGWTFEEIDGHNILARFPTGDALEDVDENGAPVFYAKETREMISGPAELEIFLMKVYDEIEDVLSHESEN